MRLEPSRTTLSGRPSFLDAARPAAVTAIPAPVVRQCASCGCDDATHIVEGQAEANGAPRIEHSVTVELRYVKRKEDVTAYLQTRGWRYRFHQGRHAMERFICRPCLNAHTLMEKEFRTKRANELRASVNHSTYYTAVCGE